VVPGARACLCLQEDFDIFDWELTAAEMATLNASTVPAGDHKACL
jgi:hypothetical protein